MSHREQLMTKATRQKTTVREFENKNAPRQNFLHNVDYEYMRKQFGGVKEKLRVHHQTNPIVNAGIGYAALKSGRSRMIKMEKTIESLRGSFASFQILGRAVISAIAIFAAVSAVKWGSSDGTWKSSCGFTEATAMGRETITRSIDEIEVIKKFGATLNSAKYQMNYLHNYLTCVCKNVVFASKKNKTE